MKLEAKDKIRDIKLDYKPYKLKLAFVLILINFLCLFAVLYLAFRINHWIAWIVEIVTLSSVAIFSYKCHNKGGNWRKISIYSNMLIIDTMFTHAEIDLKKIAKIKKIRTLLDILTNKHSNSAFVYMKNGTYYELFYLNEDIDSVIEEIMTLSKNLKQNSTIESE